MQRVSARFSLGAILIAVLLLCGLHLLPQPMLLATTGKQYPYHPTNFLSELVRTQYGPVMTGCFFLLAAGAGALATAIWPRIRREGALMALAALALFLLGCFPTDLADLTTDEVTCGRVTRIEPCTLIGRIHNPLSTLVFAPIALLAASLLWRGRTEPDWKHLRWVILGCGVLALVLLCCCCARLYLQSIGWTGRGWTGLMQRSLVLPAVLFLTYLAVHISKNKLY